MSRRAVVATRRPHRARRSAGARGGFALIEMMVTIMVFSVGLLALSSYAVTMTKQMRDGGRMVNAAALARARFEKLQARPCETLVAGTTITVSGTITEKYTIAPASRSVSVTNIVTFPSGRAMRTVTFNSIIPCTARP